MKQAEIPGYFNWQTMKTRCLNANSKHHSKYKALGIQEEWIKSFTAFITHIGPKPSKNHTIDRIDNSIGYFIGNVRWTTRLEQSRNRDYNIVYTDFGETKTLPEWIADTRLNVHNLEYATVRDRIGKEGLSVQEAFSRPNRYKKFFYEGVYYNGKELARKYDIPYVNFGDRIAKGWDLDRILKTPIKCKT